MNNLINILVLSPHVDDGELGCGATISKLSSQDVIVHYLAFSACEESVPNKYPKNILRKEVINSVSKLDINKKNCKVLNYKVRNFSKFRQNILDDIIKIREKLNPQIIFIPSLNDIHQDHEVIFKESVRAFKFNNLISYELPWNDKNFRPNFFVNLERKYIDNKIKSLSMYESQSQKKYFKSDYILSHAKFRGIQSNGKYCEAFEIINMINNKLLFKFF